jgi:predicted nucleic acid-binding protein
MSFLVDTDTCSAYLKGDQRVWSRFMQYSGGLHVSAVTVGELVTWAKRAKAPAQRWVDLQGLLGVVTVLPVDMAVATKFGELRAALLDAGTPAPDMDLLNAATALVHQLTVVTHNTQDYANVPGLRLDDWLVP